MFLSVQPIIVTCTLVAVPFVPTGAAFWGVGRGEDCPVRRMGSRMELLILAQCALSLALPAPIHSPWSSSFQLTVVLQTGNSASNTQESCCHLPYKISLGQCGRWEEERVLSRMQEKRSTAREGLPMPVSWDLVLRSAAPRSQPYISMAFLMGSLTIFFTSLLLGHYIINLK